MLALRAMASHQTFTRRGQAGVKHFGDSPPKSDRPTPRKAGAALGKPNRRQSTGGQRVAMAHRGPVLSPSAQSHGLRNRKSEVRILSGALGKGLLAGAEPRTQLPLLVVAPHMAREPARRAVRALHLPRRGPLRDVPRRRGSATHPASLAFEREGVGGQDYAGRNHLLFAIEDQVHSGAAIAARVPAFPPGHPERTTQDESRGVRLPTAAT